MNKQILLSIVIRFLLYFVHWMVLAYLPVLLKLYGLTDIQIGTVIGLFSLSSMALMLPMGVFSDFFSPKRTILFGTVLFGTYFGALMVVRTFALLLPVIFIGGLGTAALIVVTESLYLKVFGQEKRGRRVAVYQVSTLSRLRPGAACRGNHRTKSPLPVVCAGHCRSGPDLPVRFVPGRLCAHYFFV